MRRGILGVIASMVLAVFLVQAQEEAEGVRLVKQARQARDLGKVTDALALYGKAVLSLEKDGGPEHTAVATALDEQGDLLFRSSDFARAEPLLRRALTIREARLGDDLPTAATLQTLGRVLNARGRYNEAEPLFRRSLEIRESKLGKDHYLVAAGLNNLGLLYHEQARYVEAGPLLRRALEISEEKLGKDHIATATGLNNLALLHTSEGKLDAARTLHQRALEIREKQLGKEHPEVAVSLNNLATVLRQQEQFREAVPLFLRALAILEKALEADDPRVVVALSNLASVYQDAGRFADAEKLFQRSLTQAQNRLGKDHPEVARTLHNLGVLAHNQGKVGAAADFYRRALAIREARLGAAHPDVGATLNALALLEAQQGNLDAALERAGRVRRLMHTHATRTLAGLSEAEQLAFLRSQDRVALPGALALVLAARPDAHQCETAALWLLNAKGLSLATRARALLAVREPTDPQRKLALAELLDVRRQLARATLDGTANADLAAREQTLTTALQRQGVDVQPPIWVEAGPFRAVIPEGAVFVDFIRWEPYNFQKHAFGTPRYQAWITQRRGPVETVDLGEAEAIDALVREVRTALGKSPTELRARGEIEADRLVRDPLARLSKRLVDPLRPHLEKATRWILSPDGELWLVPWAALSLDAKTCAVEKHAIQLVVSGRDLLPGLAPGQAPGQRATAPVIFADPDFQGQVARPAGPQRGLSGELRLGAIPGLPATASEAEVVRGPLARIYGAEPVLYTETKATATAFLGLDRPRALSLATHGFFLPSVELETRDRERLMRDPAAKVATRIEDPLLRCGLLLAGCNKPGDAGRAGVLTGREVLSADLRGCELVILSACETGLGDVRQGEGVAGLRQAFQLAGAESVLASLWKVPDEETSLQMVAFMDALAKGKDRVEALAIAQRQRIAQRRERFGAAHPFNWAAFTLTGR